MTPEERFIENIPLVYWYLDRYYRDKITDEDYRQTAMMGLWKACLAYDESKGYKFSTHAIICISNEIKKLNKYTYEKVYRIESDIRLDNPPLNEDGEPSTDYNELLSDEELGYLSVELNDVINKVLSKYTKRSRERRREVVKKLMTGYSQAEIAEEFHLSRQRVNTIVKEFREAIMKEYTR